jgi:hypothetical protein
MEAEHHHQMVSKQDHPEVADSAVEGVTSAISTGHQEVVVVDLAERIAIISECVIERLMVGRAMASIGSSYVDQHQKCFHVMVQYLVSMRYRYTLNSWKGGYGRSCPPALLFYRRGKLHRISNFNADARGGMEMSRHVAALRKCIFMCGHLRMQAMYNLSTSLQSPEHE